MKPLRKDEIKELNKKLIDKYNLDYLSKKDNVMIKDNLIFVNKSLEFFYINNNPMPTLKFLLKKEVLKKIVVDMGAVKFMINGADLMRPGVISIEENINIDEIVAVVDEKNNKPLCLVKSLFTSEDMQKMDSGKVAKNIHYVGDDIWNSDMKS